MPLTARQLRQPPTIEAIERGPYFANKSIYSLIVLSSFRIKRISAPTSNLLG